MLLPYGHYNIPDSIVLSMASSARAVRALLFMQRCRQQAAASSRPQLAIPIKRSISDSTSLDPENFGKKLRLDQNPAEPIPEWRLPKPEPPSISPGHPDQNPMVTTTPTGIPATPAEDPYDFPRSRNAPIPRHRNNPAVKPGLYSFLKYRILRIAEPPNPNLTRTPTFNVLTNPYRARKSWPPILAQMSELQQFHYEKKFRRRLLNKTKNMRSTWDNWALFLRRFGVSFLVVYFALIAEPNDPNTRVPPDGLRYWMYGQLRKGNEVGFWPKRLGNWVEEKYQYYRRKHKRQWDPYNHDGWDESRPRNSLPGKISPAVNRPLEDPSGRGMV